MKLFFAAAILMLGLAACTGRPAEQKGHPAEAGLSHEAELEPLSYTLYSDSSELFVEFNPLVAGADSKFAAHLTRLGETFTPYTEGTVTVTLEVEGSRIFQTVEGPSSPGIFRLALKPTNAGTGTLLFDIIAGGLTDRIVIDSITVYRDEKTALAAQGGESGGGGITYLKEQAWKVEFANAPVRRGTMYDVVKATGQLLSAPGDEVTVAARSRGIVKFSSSNLVIGTPVRAGQKLFSVTGGEIAFENIDAARQSARAELATARSEYERARELIADRLVTQAEYQNAQLRYRQAQISLNNLNRNFSGGNALTAPATGFVKNVLVSEGQYVQAGQALATLTKGKRLLLRVDVPLKEAGRTGSIREAEFTLIQGQQTFNTAELNGRLISIAKTTGEGTPFVPVHFEVDSRPGLLPGSFAEVHLKTMPIPGTLVIPASALIEEQGTYYVYVQTEGESFEKREVKTGAINPTQVQVLSGVSEGERVVTKGAYQIKLSTASGTMPAHGHEH